MPTDPAGADEIRFAGQTVIVTGAGNGLGRAYALDCARLGARVVVNDLGISTEGRGSDRAAADYVVAEIRDAGGTAVANHDSVASADGCAAIAATALESFGTVHAVIHNAGFTRNAPFEEMDDDLLLPVLAVHLLGAFHLSRAVWPTLVANGYGRLVFTSSGSGVFGRTNGANYASAKAGIVGLANALALEGAPHGILVNTVMPVGATRLAGTPEPRRTRGPRPPPGGPRASARRPAASRRGCRRWSSSWPVRRVGRRTATIPPSAAATPASPSAWGGAGTRPTGRLPPPTTCTPTST